MIILFYLQKKYNLYNYIAGNFLAHACTPRTGLICVNSHQKSGKQCEDYRLRYLCPQGSIQDKTGIECRTFCDTGFTDDDNPSGYCDCERGPSCPGGVAPAGIRCLEVKTNKDYKQLGQNITCQPDVSI